MLCKSDKPITVEYSERGAGGQDREIQSRINAASQVFRSLEKSVFTSNHVDLNSKLHFYSCLVLSRLTYGAAEPWALTGSQAAQLETFLHAPHDGPVPGHRGPLHS